MNSEKPRPGGAGRFGRQGPCRVDGTGTDLSPINASIAGGGRWTDPAPRFPRSGARHGARILPGPGPHACQLPGPAPSPAPRLCAAVVDRLTFGGNLIQTGRLTLTQARAAAQAAAG